VINGGIQWQVAFLVFGLTFALACATVIFGSRIRRGWQMTALEEQKAGV
jgi:hypothetical protein